MFAREAWTKIQPPFSVCIKQPIPYYKLSTKDFQVLLITYLVLFSFQFLHNFQQVHFWGPVHKRGPVWGFVALGGHPWGCPWTTSLALVHCISPTWRMWFHSATNKKSIHHSYFCVKEYIQSNSLILRYGYNILRYEIINTSCRDPRKAKCINNMFLSLRLCSTVAH